MQFVTPDCQLEIVDVEAANEHPYDANWHLTPGAGIEKRLGVRCTQGDTSRSCLVSSYGFSSVNHRCAVFLGQTLILAIGNRVCGIGLPGLDLMWSAQVDPSAVFGVYLLPNDDTAIIAHGELDIVRVDKTGDVVWRTSGRDILTGELTIESGCLRIADFDGARYRIELADGATTMEYDPRA